MMISAYSTACFNYCDIYTTGLVLLQRFFIAIQMLVTQKQIQKKKKRKNKPERKFFFLKPKLFQTYNYVDKNEIKTEILNYK